MSDCWAVGSGPVDPFAPTPAPAPAPGPAVEDESNDGLRTPARPEAAEGVKGIEGGWMVTPFIPSGRVWSKAPVPKKEWTTMVSDRMLAGYPALNALSRDEIKKPSKKQKDETYGDPSGASTKINVLENDLYVPEGNSLNCPCIIKHNLTWPPSLSSTQHSKHHLLASVNGCSVLGTAFSHHSANCAGSAAVLRVSIR